MKPPRHDCGLSFPVNGEIADKSALIIFPPECGLNPAQSSSSGILVRESSEMAPSPVSSSPSEEEIWQQQSYRGYLALNAAVVVGIVLWDYLQLLPEERSLYERRRRREWRSPAPWAFVALRYSTLVSTLCGTIYTSLKLDDCQNVISVGQGGSVLAFAAAGVIFCSRVGSLWNYQRVPLAIVFVPCIIMICTWMAFAAQFRASTSTAQLLAFGSNCQFSPLEIWTPLSFAITATFNTTVSSLVIARVFTKSTVVAMNTGLTLINRACILYVLCATLPSIAIACVYAAFHSSSSSFTVAELVKRAAAPYLLLVMMTMASRVFLNLQLHHQVLTRVAESNHFTSPTWTPPTMNMGSVSPNPEKVISNPKPRSADELDFEPALTMLSVPESDVLSLDIDRYMTRTRAVTTIPPQDPVTPLTLTSFSGSTVAFSGASSAGSSASSSNYNGPPGPRSRRGSMSTRSHARAGSVRSAASSSGSTRAGYATPLRSPPRSERVGSIRSVATSSLRETEDAIPKVPTTGTLSAARNRNGNGNGSLRVGSIRSVGSGSTRFTGYSGNGGGGGSTRSSGRRARMASFNSFATSSKLPMENLKSTWHGV